MPDMAKNKQVKIEMAKASKLLCIFAALIASLVMHAGPWRLCVWKKLPSSALIPIRANYRWSAKLAVTISPDGAGAQEVKDSF